MSRLGHHSHKPSRDHIREAACQPWQLLKVISFEIPLLRQSVCPVFELSKKKRSNDISAQCRIDVWCVHFLTEARSECECEGEGEGERESVCVCVWSFHRLLSPQFSVVTRQSWFEPISTRRGLGKRLTNRIGCARCPSWRYRYEARGMHYHILLRQYSPNYFTLLHSQQCGENTYSRCHKDACVQISIGNTEWLLRH